MNSLLSYTLLCTLVISEFSIQSSKSPTFLSKICEIRDGKSSHLGKFASELFPSKAFHLRMTYKIDITNNLSHHKLENKWKHYFSSMNQKEEMFEEKVAIIISAKERNRNLRIFMKNIIPFVIRQNAYFKITVVEPVDLYNINRPFNSGFLRNVGFVETTRMKENFTCFIFHDVDLIPVNTRIEYTCKKSPKILFKTIQNYADRSQRKYLQKTKLRNSVHISPNKRGCGVLAISKPHFLLVNGFANAYWGWGNEDYDMHLRIRNKNLTMKTQSICVGNFYHLDHPLDWKPTKKNNLLIKTAHKRFNSDGLNNVQDFYEVIHINKFIHYTHIYVALLDNNSK